MMRIARIHHILPALLLLAAPAAAQGGAPPQFRLDRVLVLGGDFGDPDETFVDVSDVATSPAGDIYVLDAGDRAVKVYSAAGRFVRRFGRQGGGPGEFQLPTSIRVDSLVRVSDPQQARMSYFAMDGRHLRSARSPEVGERPVNALAPLRNGRVVGTTPAVMRVQGDGTSTGSMYVPVLVLGPGGQADTLLRQHSGAFAFRPRSGTGAVGMYASHAGQGGAYAVLGDSVVATADGYSGEVRWYRADRGGMTLVRTRQLPSRSRAVTPDDVRRMERDLRATGRQNELPRQLVIDPPPRVSIATQALFAADGSLWIRNTAGAGHAHVWTVFDARGDIAYRLSLPAGFDLRHVRADLLYGTARTGNGAPVVHVYRLVRRG
jgi:6-bladed beta-propeller